LPAVCPEFVAIWALRRLCRREWGYKIRVPAIAADGRFGVQAANPGLLFSQEDLNIAASKRVKRNEEIEASEVRVIDSAGEQAGVMPLAAALEIAKGEGLDLVEVSPTASPPVCRVMDFGKYLFELNKKAQTAKRKQKQVHVKEIKFRPGTDEGDYKIKLRKLINFLEHGDKTKVTLRFRGREMAHQELGAKLLARVRDDLNEIGVVEQMPQMEGRQMVMVMSPKKK
jgi:translation initiation factor IF-3